MIGKSGNFGNFSRQSGGCNTYKLSRKNVVLKKKERRAMSMWKKTGFDSIPVKLRTKIVEILVIIIVRVCTYTYTCKNRELGSFPKEEKLMTIKSATNQNTTYYLLPIARSKQIKICKLARWRIITAKRRVIADNVWCLLCSRR